MRSKIGLGVVLVTDAFLVFRFRGGVKDTTVIYASLVVSGYKIFGQVPRVIQPQVREVLTQLGLEGLAE